LIGYVEKCQSCSTIIAEGTILCHACQNHWVGDVEVDLAHLRWSEEAMKIAEKSVKASGQVTSGKVSSDGGSTSYYELPEHATELKHLISYREMSFARGNIFKACYRLGAKEGNDALYDLRKMQFFIEELIEMHERGERL
jgi:hypothetical protein